MLFFGKNINAALTLPFQAKDTNKAILELETKLKYLENKSEQLEKENNYLHNNVQNLEGELEEVQDNFREDEVDEYRHLKRDLEASAKNCRVLQFKLKKAEKTIVELSGAGGGGGAASAGPDKVHDWSFLNLAGLFQKF